MLSRKGKNNSDGSFNWADALVDAGITAGLTFVTSIGSMSAVNSGITENILIGSALAAAGQFFLFLAIKRGLREKQND